MKKAILLTVLLAVLTSVTFSQVAINETGADPDPSAILDLSSSDKGFLVPRVSTTERNAIATTQSGLLVYDIDTESFWYYNNMLANWVEMSGGGDDGDWVVSGNNMYSSVSGNVGIGNPSPDSPLDILGNTWDNIVKISVDNFYNNALIFSSGAQWASISGSSTNRDDIVIEHESGEIGIGTTNPAATLDVNGSIRMTDGNQGTGKVLTSNANGVASWETPTVYASDINGLNDGLAFSSTVYLGDEAGTFTTGNNNTGIGHQAGRAITTGFANTSIGKSANENNEIGFRNTAIGAFAGRGTFGGPSVSDCIFIGVSAGSQNTSDNKLFIDVTDTSTPLIGGDFSTNQVDINGTIKISGGNPDIGKVLTSNANGVASWETPTVYALDINGLSDGLAFSSTVYLGDEAGTFTTGNNNTGIGHQASRAITTGFANTSIGKSANENNEIGFRNTAIGAFAGRGTFGGPSVSDCIFIGVSAGSQNTSDNKLFIDVTSTSTPLIGGDFSTNQVDINGDIKISGGNPGIGKVLTSDADGLASWVDIPAGVTQLNDLADAKSDFYNVFVGYNSGENNDGGNNNASLGASSLFSNTSGIENTSLGKASLYFNTIGSGNVAVGRSALYKNELGYSNVALGIHSLYNNVDRSNLVAIGDSSLFNNGSGATMTNHGSENTAVGSKSLFNNTLGSQNTAVGTESLKANTIGKDNTAMGAYALDNNIDGDNNTAVGAFALTFNTTGTYNTTVGYKSLYNHTSGDFNTAVGGMSMYSDITGTHNTALGYTSLFLNTTGSRNTALGVKALYNNTTGTNNLAIGNFALYKNDITDNNIAIGDSTLYNNGSDSPSYYQSVNNIAIGQSALKANTGGYFNIGIGTKALYENTNGEHNIAIGLSSLEQNIAGHENISLGNYALNVNEIGYSNIAIGEKSMNENKDGHNNIGIGRFCLSENKHGDYNVAIGDESLNYTEVCDYNTAVGYRALTYLDIGDNNTAIGYDAGPYIGNGQTIINSTAIGATAPITASNQVRIGNWFVTSIGGEVGWTTISDGRFKNNVKENVLGLDFILKLRPVTYQVDKDGLQQFLGVKNQKQKEGREMIISIESGFIAQEVETTVQELGFEFSGIDAPKNDKDYYGLRYGQFVVPLVKGMQEQQKQIETIKAENAELKVRLEKLENILNQK